MNIKPLKTRSRIKGISMIEMIASIAIISIVAGIASPVMVGTKEEAKLRVLAANIDHINSLMRGAKQFGAKGTKASEIASGAKVSVDDVCAALTTKPQVWVDADGDGTIDSSEFAFEMDYNEGVDPYTHLISDNLVDGYSVAVKKTNPVQLAIFKGSTEVKL